MCVSRLYQVAHMMEEEKVGNRMDDRQTSTCAKVDGSWVSAVAAIDCHVTLWRDSLYVLFVSSCRVSLGNQLRHAQLTYIDGRSFRL